VNFNVKLWTHDRLKPKNWQGQRAAWKQSKLNGHRFTAFKQANGTLVGFEREVRPDLEITRKRPHVVKYDWWKQLEGVPPKSSVDGELYVVRGNAGTVAHAIAEGDGSLEFRPFAVPWWEGKDCERESLSWAQTVLKFSTGLKLIPFYRLAVDDSLERLLQDAEDLGTEGWVLKNYNYGEWWKVKPTKTVDCVVTGFKDGNGKYLGLVGALKVSAKVDGKMTELASVSGMDDVTRVDIDEDEDLGRVVEVEYQEVGNGGRLIHPRFVRWRDDKPADQCEYDEEEL